MSDFQSKTYNLWLMFCVCFHVLLWLDLCCIFFELSCCVITHWQCWKLTPPSVMTVVKCVPVRNMNTNTITTITRLQTVLNLATSLPITALQPTFLLNLAIFPLWVNTFFQSVFEMADPLKRRQNISDPEGQLNNKLRLRHVKNKHQCIFLMSNKGKTQDDSESERRQLDNWAQQHRWHHLLLPVQSGAVRQKNNHWMKVTVPFYILCLGGTVKLLFRNTRMKSRELTFLFLAAFSGINSLPFISQPAQSVSFLYSCNLIQSRYPWHRANLAQRKWTPRNVRQAVNLHQPRLRESRGKFI